MIKLWYTVKSGGSGQFSVQEHIIAFLIKSEGSLDFKSNNNNCKDLTAI